MLLSNGENSFRNRTETINLILSYFNFKQKYTLYFLYVDRIVLRITNEGAMLAQNDVFFVATSPFLGDKRSSYGQSLSFVIRLVDPAMDVNVTTGGGFGDVIARDTGDVILTGRYTNFTLVTNISVVGDGRKHSLSVNYRGCIT